MPRDGKGVFTRTNGTFTGPDTWSQQAASASDEINSGRHDTHDEDIAQALTGSVATDGQSPMAGNLNMADNRIINLGSPLNNADAARYGIQPPGRATIRNLTAQSGLEQAFRDVTDPDFGADKTGVANSSPAFQAAIDAVASGEAVVIKVPAGVYLLNTDVTPNGRIASAQIDPDATFTGAGTLKLFNSPNYGNLGQKNSYVAVIRGSSTAPITEPSAIIAASKHSNAAEMDGIDTVAHFSAFKHFTTQQGRLQSLFCETQDLVGGPGTFVESGRFHTLLNPDLAEMAAAIQDDGGVFTDETAQANSDTVNDMNLLPAVPVAGDAYLFGASSPFSQLRIRQGTAGAGTYTITWKYWNGTIWAALNNVRDGTSDFKFVGQTHVKFNKPPDWVAISINGQGPFYYVKAEVDGGTVTTVPLGTRSWTTETGRSNGSVFFAGTSVYPEYLIAVEATVFNNSGIDAAAEWSRFENSTCFLASGSEQAGSSNIHSWYATWGQPAGVTTARVGYLVGPNRTSDAAFRTLADTTYGLDLVGGSQSFAAIHMPNGCVIRARNGADDNSHNILSYNANNILNLGTNAEKVQCTVVDTAQINPLSRTVIYDAIDSGGVGFRRLLVPN